MKPPKLKLRTPPSPAKQLRNIIYEVCDESIESAVIAEEDERKAAEARGPETFNDQIGQLGLRADLAQFAIRYASKLANRRDNPTLEIAQAGAKSPELEDTSKADVEAPPAKDALKK
jgi:hypothetical protein